MRINRRLQKNKRLIAGIVAGVLVAVMIFGIVAPFVSYLGF